LKFIFQINTKRTNSPNFEKKLHAGWVVVGENLGRLRATGQRLLLATACA
jgi:hypothetical protein